MDGWIFISCFFFCRKEISLIRIRGFIVSSIYALFFTSSTIAGFMSVTTLLLTEHSLTSFKVFTLLSALANIKFFVTIFIAESLRYIADARTAIDRMQRLIEKESDLTDKTGDKGEASEITASQHTQPQVVLKDVSCFWSPLLERPTLQNVSLSATCGEFVGVTGPVGGGKTSLLMTILGELPVSSGYVSCTGKMAFVSQTPWVFSGTLRENIVFGMRFDKEKYNKVIELCDLGEDIANFPKRDLTEIGQRGAILSGGQRARVSLARAIYSDADIYLLDDPLSAVDAKVGKHLFDKCIKEFLAGRVRILATHQLQYLKQTDNVVELREGSVVYQGTYSQKRNQDSAGETCDDNLTVSILSEETVLQEVDKKTETERVDLKDEEEDRMVGSVKWWLYWKYLRAALPIALIASLVLFFGVVQGNRPFISCYSSISSLSIHGVV